MPANPDPRAPIAATERNYFYRRRLGARDLLPAIGIGLAAGALAFYVARVMIERTPLIERADEPSARRRSRRLRGGSRG